MCNWGCRSSAGAGAGAGSSPGRDGASPVCRAVLSGAGTVHPGVRIRPHAFPRTKADIKGHAIGNVERTWEARKAFSVKARFLAVFCPTSPHPPAPRGSVGSQRGPIDL